MIKIPKPILIKIGKYFLIITGTALLIGVGFYFWQNYSWKRGIDTSCVTTEKHNIKGNSMAPLLANGEQVKGLAGYYDCNQTKREDIAVIEFKTREESFVKKIAGIPGDELKFESSQLKLNGEILKNSAGTPYLFSSQAKKIITIPLEGGKIPEGRYLILSDERGPDAFDSRQYGFVQTEHLKGKVIK